ncbi:histone-lysine N-methyltransferase SETMAR-like [Stegodyphus dumicola]|uniref:histone-lysine N-methyltransferase SETMAR-like n=1 Tax=Stegodyphus dumicola TaxID=202533 RepID=UPI0015B1D0C0|nr:histone-lysine N-methyltransferase SETMAR-like [Stegodyphus dumicola]
MTINGQFYTEVLDQLRKRIRRVRPFKKNGSWLLLHDNACPHIALPVRQFLAQHDVEMQHPPYSSDLALADFFLFPKLKNLMKGTRFQDVEAIEKRHYYREFQKRTLKLLFEICTAEHGRALRLMGITLNHIKWLRV